MHLDEFLNSRSIVNLQTFQFFWAPTGPRSSSKSELLRILRREMLSPGRVRTLFDGLSNAHRDMLRTLLRSEGYTTAADVLLRRVPSAGPGSAPAHEVLRDLDRQGFVARVEARGPNGRTAESILIPLELADVLAEVLNLDLRDPALMLSLQSLLTSEGSHPEGSLTHLVLPTAVEARIAALPDAALQRAVGVALSQPAGILPLERFPAHGLDMEAVDPSAWRRLLEQSHLGTFGHLDLDDFALGDDHDCLVLYQEVVQSRLAPPLAVQPPVDHTYACGVDFITDLATLVDFLRANPSKLTGTARLFKGARNQLLPRMACRTTFFMDEETLLAHKLTVARRLGLLEMRGDERLHTSASAAAWQARPLGEQARSVLDALLAMIHPLLPRHFRHLTQTALEFLADLPADSWLPTRAFVSLVLSRHLMGILARGEAMLDPPSEDAPAGVAPARDDVAWRTFQPGSPTLEEIAAAITEPFLRALNYVGLIDIGRAADHSFLRPTALAPFLLRDAPLPPLPPNRLLLVNPDGEVVLFPEGQVVELLHQLSAFCDRGKSEVTVHLRLSRESVQRAALRGLSAESILALLRRHCRVPLAQNIEYSVRNWVASIHPAAIETLHVLALPSAEALDAALRLPEIAPLVLRRLSPTAVALTVPDLSPEAQDALAQLGIYLT
jgi:hypothetical protein